MEKLFGRIWKTKSAQQKTRSGFVELEDIQRQIETFARCCSQSNHEIVIGGSLWSVGFCDSELLLPKSAAWTLDTQLNIRVVEYLVLVSTAVKSLGLSTQFSDRSRIWPRLYILKKMPEINRWLDQHFPQFPSWQEELLKTVHQYLRPSAILPDPLYRTWSNLVASRAIHRDDDTIKDLDRRMSACKRNDTPPDFLYATIPLPYRTVQAASDTKKAQNRTPNKDAKTNKSRNQKEYVEEVDLEKKGAANPVIHSFEKLETLDDYEDGRKIESGEDELQEHTPALDEVELNRHTSEGEASSNYSQNIVGLSSALESPAPPPIALTHTYPEWSARNSSYWRSYCTVYPRVAESKPEWRERKRICEKKFESSVTKWKKQLSGLLNVPLWAGRKPDGSELDIDSLVRYQSEPNQLSDRPLIYATKSKARLDISMLILADCSYSTDSWVNGLHVIDIIKDSLEAGGLLLEGLVDEVFVASTNSQTRNQVDFCQLKSFDEPWSAMFPRMGDFVPRQYTRLGPAIRHATHLLTKQSAVSPMMVLMTDGKPTDLDPYEGSHGEEDIHIAVREAKAKGVKFLALTASDFDPPKILRMFESVASIAGPDEFCENIVSFLRNQMHR